MLKTRFIHFRNKKLFFSESGEGTTVLLIHGFLETFSIWGKFAEDLSAFSRVIAVDLPGHGKSETIPGCSMDVYADALFEILILIGCDKAFIVGHSMGGYASLAFARKYPEKVHALCLFHSVPYADSEEKKRQRKNSILEISQTGLHEILKRHIPMVFAEKNQKVFDTSIKTIIENHKILDPQGIIESLNAMIQRPDYGEFLQKFHNPLLYIFGRHDRFISQTVFDQITFPVDTKIEILEDSGHLGFVEEKDKSVEFFRNFMIKKNLDF
jgi:pimeloyl-ACP methyl ester carboxylesterase